MFMSKSIKDFPSFVWGTHISVEKIGDALVVHGGSPAGPNQQRDFLWKYRDSATQVTFGQKRSGAPSPHLVFANCESDTNLIRFVESFGPVAASLFEEDEMPDWDWKLQVALQNDFQFPIFLTRHAWQDMDVLRNEREIYSSALSLVVASRQKEDVDTSFIISNMERIVERISMWPAQWRRERLIGKPTWRFSEEDSQQANQLLQQAKQINRSKWNPFTAKDDALELLLLVLNAFPVQLASWGPHLFEVPGTDLTFGVRPLLYFLLRQEVMKRIGAFNFCANDHCRKAFEIRRSGQLHCDADCSRMQRQRVYARNKRREQSQARASKVKKKKVSLKTNGEK